MKLLTQVSKELKDYLYSVITSGEFHHFKDLEYDYVDSVFADGGAAFVSTDDNGSIDGVLVFYVSDVLPTFPGQRVAVEHIWYSGNGKGKELYESFIFYAKELGCTRVMMSCHHGNRVTEAVMHFYKKQGYVPCETTFIKELA